MKWAATPQPSLLDSACGLFQYNFSGSLLYESCARKHYSWRYPEKSSASDFKCCNLKRSFIVVSVSSWSGLWVPFTNKLVWNCVRSWWMNPSAQDQQEAVLMTGIKRSSGLQPKPKLPLLWTCQVPENSPNNSFALVLILRAEEALIKIHTEAKLLLKTDPLTGTNWKLFVKE